MANKKNPSKRATNNSNQKNLCFSSPQYNKEAIASLNKLFPGIAFELTDSAFLRKNGLFSLIRSFRCCHKAVFFTYDLEITGKPPVWVTILNWISRKGAYLADTKGRLIRAGWMMLLFSSLPRVFVQLVSLPFEWISLNNLIHRLKADLSSTRKISLPATSTRVAYFRTDLDFGTKAGGSVGHISGVINAFLEHGFNVFVVSTDSLELIDVNKTPLHIVRPDAKYNFLSEIPQIHYNKTLLRQARHLFEKEKPHLIYQRYSLNNFTGVFLSTEFHVPFILEYNGSEVWIARNWGRRLKHEKLGKNIELLNFNAAHLITVVSRPLKEEIIRYGVPSKKILVNPNGVDPQRYHPGIDGSRIRKQYGLEDKTVVGFIGTFGNWHGAEVLAKAAVLLAGEIKTKPDIHFLFIGDGVKLPLTRQIIQEGNIENRVTFTGMVPQEQGPEYLAACDILVAPHVPNPDGSPFFGSPTKLFEYMAMGKGIVASNLDQIGEVLKHEQTAWMVEPGNVSDLAQGILSLVNNKGLREKLGANARREVLEKYTWRQHVAKMMNKLAEVLGS